MLPQQDPAEYPRVIDGDGETDSDRMVDLERFFDLVSVMRKNQKDYCLTHSKTHLDLSLKSERDVDTAIAAIRFPQRRLL